MESNDGVCSLAISKATKEKQRKKIKKERKKEIKKKLEIEEKERYIQPDK